MSKKIITILIILLIIILGSVYFFFFRESGANQEEQTQEENTIPSQEDLEQAFSQLEEQSKELTEEVVEEDIVGLWDSLDRQGYTVEFTSDGVMTEKLGPSQTDGEWELVSFNEGPDGTVGTISFSQEGVFLQQSLDEGKSKFYYKVVQVNENNLTVLYLHQGGVLTFKRSTSN